MKVLDDYSTIYNVVLDDVMRVAPGLSYYDDFYAFKNYYKIHVVLPEEQFRPDKIAYNLWDNQYISWVLDTINNITDLSEYYVGREINYLEEDFLRTLGIL